MIKLLGMLLFLTSSSRAFRSVSSNKRSSVAPLAANFLEQMFSSTASSLANNNNAQTGFYTIAITGANGLVGTALRNELSQRGTLKGKPIRVVQLQRDSKTAETTLNDDKDTMVPWNPKATSANDVLHPNVVKQLDAIVHLAGENVATGLGPLGFLGLRPWTNEKKTEILDSRVGPTRALAQVCKSVSKNNNNKLDFLVASGVGVYGDDFIGDNKEAVDETANTMTTKGFLADVSRAWEGATKEAKSNARVVNMRFGVVLSKKGGALAKLFPIFFLGGGGTVGFSGQQYFSFISARDIARAIVHSLETPSLTGPVNVCAPNPCTNAEFTKAFGQALNRPTILPFPGFAVDFLFGEMGQEMLLGGVRCLPTKLEKSGFKFLHPTVDEALQSALEESI